MIRKHLRLISNFNISPLAGYLRNTDSLADWIIETAPYGQVHQELARRTDSWADILWTTPERILPNFYNAFQFEDISHDLVLADVDDFADSIIDNCQGRYVFVASWELPHGYHGHGMLDWRDGVGLSNLLAKCNLRLAEKLTNEKNIFILDAQQWMRVVVKPCSDKMWYATKVPYSVEVFSAAARNIELCISGIQGKSRRLIVLDLDNTLWGGVVGENGWQGLRLGGHDHLGEAFKDFQQALKALSNRGIQLALASKNDENVAFEAIDNHPEMILHRSEFAGWRINWNDKAANIIDLVDELNLGLESVVFIDDNPVERMRVAEAVPEIFVPEWPKDPALYVSALRALNCFEVPAVSIEDRERTAMYVAERSRREAKYTVGSTDNWLTKLGTSITVSSVNASNSARVTQLFNKTNQLNLTTRRLSEKEITDWVLQGRRSMRVISVSDQFGDMGLVGIISVEANGDEGHLVDFILSCRVMGRKVEEALIHIAVSELAELNTKTMDLTYLPTERNRPTLEVLESANLLQIDPHSFRVDVTKGYEKPSTVKLNWI
jgi:FkbH-like protein